MKFPRETEKNLMGWCINYDYLSLIKEIADACDKEYSSSLEQIEVVLLAIEALERTRSVKW